MHRDDWIPPASVNPTSRLSGSVQLKFCLAALANKRADAHISTHLPTDICPFLVYTRDALRDDRRNGRITGAADRGRCATRCAAGHAQLPALQESKYRSSRSSAVFRGQTLIVPFEDLQVCLIFFSFSDSFGLYSASSKILFSCI